MIFGTDYVVREREAQARMLRDAVTRHVDAFQNPSWWSKNMINWVVQREAC